MADEPAAEARQSSSEAASEPAEGDVGKEGDAEVEAGADEQSQSAQPPQSDDLSTATHDPSLMTVATKDGFELEYAGFQDEPRLGMGRTSELGPAITFSSSSDEEEEEDDYDYFLEPFASELGIKEIEETIDRDAFVEEYNTLLQDRVPIRRKNGYLHRKIAEYFKKRKMDNVFDEVPMSIAEELETKCDKKLIDLYELREKSQRERDAITCEINDMKSLRDEQRVELERKFRAMQIREKETATGLIDTRTGKVISDKVVERLILRQKAKSQEMAEIRLTYIKQREKVREIEQQLKSLETIGGTLHLMDFEQLRMENQNYSDKIEERDDELTRLRARFSSAIQALAHIREKCSVVEQQITDLNFQTANEEEDVNTTREQLNRLKIERDTYRAESLKLKSQSGLMTYSSLLRDMETSINETQKLSKELEALKMVHAINRQKLTGIRHTIVVYSENADQKRTQRPQVTNKASSTDQRYRYRPTLFYPVIPKE